MILSVGVALRLAQRAEFLDRNFKNEAWPSFQSDHANHFRTMFMTDRHVQIILDAWDRSKMSGAELTRQSGVSVELLKVLVKKRKLSLYSGGRLALALGDFL